MGKTLDELVLDYRATGEGLDLIFETLTGLIYERPERFGFDGVDDAAEAILRYRQRIRSLPARYEDTGSSFEAYLCSCLRFIARTMMRNRKRRREKELVCERHETWQFEEKLEAGGELVLPPDGERPLAFEGGRLRSRCELSAFRSRLVFLYLKCAWDSSDERTRLVAAVSEVPVDWLAAVTAQALRSLEDERLRFEKLSSRRDRSWGRLRLLEGRLREELDAAGKLRISDALQREKSKLERTRTELSSFRPVVPNSVVARVLGVPKGTVDSGLYYLRRKGLVLKR
jgi:DNA-directed RNA polymerase specialized sigma24 family protein